MIFFITGLVLNFRKSKLDKTATGFSTLEVAIAFALIILSLTAVIGLVFSAEFLSIDSELSSKALSKAQSLLKVEKNLAVSDFYSVKSFGPVTDGEYLKNLEVQNLGQYTKQISAKVSWQVGGKNNSVQLSTLVIDKAAALGGDSCNQEISGNWKNPQIINLDLAQIAGFVGDYSVSSIDAYQGRLYIGVDSTTNKSDPTLFIFDIASTTQPILVSAIDNDVRVQAGITAIKVVGNYAYLATTSSYSRGQLQIVDVSINPPQVIKTYKVPVINSLGNSKGLGSSIFYKNNLVYLGLTKTDSEREFNIVDVSDPLSPILKSSRAIGNGVNTINVRGDYAYLAHPTDISENPQEQLTVLDISNSSQPIRTGGFYFNGSSGGNGKSIYLLGDELYFGRTASKISGQTADVIPEFFLLNNAAQNNPTSTLGSLALATPQSLNGIIVRGNLGYFVTTNQFQVWDLNYFSNITAWSPAVNIPGVSTSFDCQDNTFFVSSVDQTSKGIISIITAGN
jgi:hypothetical protein